MSNDPPIEWSPTPPPVPVASILRVPQAPIWIIRTGPWLGVWLHWLGKRTFPCFGKDCPVSRHRRPIHWTGYLPALVPPAVPVIPPPAEWKPTVLPVSDVQVQELAEHVAAGRILWSICGRKNGKGWELREAKKVRAGVEVPPPIKVESVLFRCWGIRPPASAEPGDVAGAPPGVAAPEGQARIFREVD